MTDFPKRQREGVDLIVPIAGCSRVHIKSDSSNGHQSNLSGWCAFSQTLRISILWFCFPYCKKLYLGSCEVSLSNSEPVICQIPAFQSRDVWGMKETDFKICARTCSDLQFFLMGKIPYQKHASIAQQITQRNTFRSWRWLICTSDGSLHLLY